ncbi:MAG: hypothetical protein WD042_01950 [Phycisphaeraceae bacterium]
MQRPVPILVFGILNLVFAALGLCGHAGSGVLLIIPDVPSNPGIHLMHTNAGYRGFVIASLVAGLPITALLAGAGAGLLSSKAWGRTLSIVYAYASILFTILTFVGTLMFMMPPLIELARQNNSPENYGALGGGIGGMVGSLIGLAYPIVLLVFMYRPSVRAFFAQPQPAEAMVNPW